MSNYDAFAAEFDAHAQNSAYNAYYDRPALLDLLGPVDGLRVLDAGCGSGLYSSALIERGASVSGFDISANLVALALERLGKEADFRVHDLNEPLYWIEDGTYDRAVLALVLHHLENPVPALRELHRALHDNGKLLLSTLHPTSDWLRYGGSYFRDEMVTETWHNAWDVRFRRVPLQTLVQDFQAAGFIIERLIEPRPIPEMANLYPKVFQKLNEEPAFIAFQLSKYDK